MIGRLRYYDDITINSNNRTVLTVLFYGGKNGEN